jgi:hypothetical protein
VSSFAKEKVKKFYASFNHKVSWPNKCKEAWNLSATDPSKVLTGSARINALLRSVPSPITIFFFIKIAHHNVSWKKIIV